MAGYDSIKEFLRSGCYLSDYTKDQKLAFRRKASNYKYERGVLYLFCSCWKESIVVKAKLETRYNEYIGTRQNNGKLSCCPTRYNISNYICLLSLTDGEVHASIASN